MKTNMLELTRNQAEKLAEMDMQANFSGMEELQCCEAFINQESGRIACSILYGEKNQIRKRWRKYRKGFLLSKAFTAWCKEYRVLWDEKRGKYIAWMYPVEWAKRAGVLSSANVPHDLPRKAGGRGALAARVPACRG